jgi:hypothetical protein
VRVTFPVWFIGPPIQASTGRRPSFHPEHGRVERITQEGAKTGLDDYV